MKRNAIRWAPWPGPEGAFQVRVLSGTSRRGYVSVRWISGPLKGREANLEARTLRAGPNLDDLIGNLDAN